jgi:hypothetical protein
LNSQILTSGAIWSVLLAVPFIFVGHTNFSGICLIAFYILLSSGLTCVSIPHTGIANLCLLVLGCLVGLTLIGSLEAFLAFVILALTAQSLYAIVYNLHYMFATRRLRTRILREANETVQLLLNDFDEQGSDWLWEIDIDGLIIDPSLRFLVVAKRAESDLVGQSFIGLFEVGRERTGLEGLIKTGQPFRDIVLSISIEDEQHWISGSRVRRKCCASSRSEGRLYGPL